MELLSGFPLLLQQTNALLKKNFILSWRSRRAKFLQLFSSFFFIAFMFGIQKTDDYRAKNPTFGDAVTDPRSVSVLPIPECEDKLFMNLPCYDFVWSGSGNGRIESVVNRIMANNPGRPIPPSKVKAFTTKQELNKWLMDNPMRVPGALHFVETNAKEIRYGVQTNSTSYVQIGRQIEDPVFMFQIPLQHAASRETFRSLIGIWGSDPTFSCDVGIKEFAHPARQVSSEYTSVDSFGSMFFFATAMFGFVFQANTLVQEKELKLRQTMSIMGLYNSAYWCSWLLWEGLMAFLSSILIVVFGEIFQLDLFLKNKIVLVFILLLLFALSMVGFAFLISTFISKTASMTTVGFFIFLIGLVTTSLTNFFYTGEMKQIYQILWSVFPPNTFAQGLTYLLDASKGDGMSWSKRTQCQDSEGKCFTLNYIYAWLISTFFLWSILAIYFDNIFPNSAGVRKSVLYFLMPSYWTGRGETKLEEDLMFLGSNSTAARDRIISDDEDVCEEENSVKEAAKRGTLDPNVAVQLCGLVKTYSKSINMNCHRFCFCCFCCICKVSKPYDAVKGLWMNFPKNQLFCLLGPNGAGKTTSISCLTGITPVTRGDVIVYGNSVRSSIGMSTIRRMMGVCPQEAQTLLADVKLDKVLHVRSGSYSCGMKRRISFAIALIGDPKLVILDEPTTGMDPVTRRRIWNLIKKAKQGRSIILTTHSMMEAEILSDRIGIMAKGRLRCIGTSSMLKSRFGAGYVAKVIFSKAHSNVLADGLDVNAENRKAVKLFFRQHLNITPEEETPSFLSFVLPNSKEETLADFFCELESRETEFGIKNIQLGLGTLEEVFLNIAKKAELETADPKESIKNITLTSGASLQVPLGAKYVQIPGTESAENPRGLMVEISWRQDDKGNLCISRHSAEMPVPTNLQPVASSSFTSPGNVLGQKGSNIGIALE